MFLSIFLDLISSLSAGVDPFSSFVSLPTSRSRGLTKSSLSRAKVNLSVSLAIAWQILLEN
jgi:hypothetical protein